MDYTHQVRDDSDGVRCDKRPIWIHDESVEYCLTCQSAFNFANRRHHCRHCGHVFCNSCCWKKRPLPYMAYTIAVRVCNHCYDLCETADRLLDAVKVNDIEVLQQLVLDKGVPVDFSVGDYTALTCAAYRGHTKVLAILLEQGANVHGTPELRSAHDESTTIVQCESCGRVSTYESSSHNLYKCWECKFSTKQKERVASALSELLPSAVRRPQVSPVQLAAYTGATDCVRLLVEAEADLAYTTPENPDNALAWAINGGHIPTVEYLVSLTDPNSPSQPWFADSMPLDVCIANCRRRRNVLALFENSLWMTWNALANLYRKSDRHHQLHFSTTMSRLIETAALISAMDPMAVDFYIPQLCDLMMHTPHYESRLTAFMMSLTRSSLRFALELSFYIGAIKPAVPKVADALLSAIQEAYCANDDSLTGGGARDATPGRNIDESPLPPDGGTRADGKREGDGPAGEDKIESTVVDEQPACLVAAGRSAGQFTATVPTADRCPATLEEAEPNLLMEDPGATTPAGKGQCEAGADNALARSEDTSPSCDMAMSATPVREGAREKLHRRRAALFERAHLFARDLAAIGAELTYLLPEHREAKLQVFIERLGRRLQSGTFLPIFKHDVPLFSVLRMPPTECTVFNTRTRAPYRLCVEVASLAHEDEMGGHLSTEWLQTDSRDTEAVPASYEGEMALYTAFGDESAHKTEAVRSTSPHGHLPGWRLLNFIVKSGDDLRQELFAMQLICQFKRMFLDAALPLYLRPYQVCVTAADAGLIEMVPDAISLDILKKKLPHLTSLGAYFEKVYGDPSGVPYQAVQKNFVESLAAYSVVSYLLQIKDRHNANVLIDRWGHLVHIDFGFMLSNGPGAITFERAPFKLTQEFVEVMGGTHSPSFLYFRSLCLQGFLVARQNFDRITNIVKMMMRGLGSKLKFPCFSGGDECAADLKKHLVLDLDTEGVAAHVDQLIDQSLDHWTTRQYDKYQKFTNNISV